MKEQIFWLDVLLKKVNKISILILFLFSLIPSIVFASERWIIDKDLSSITFELPVLLVKNVQGIFTNIEGFVEIDVDQKKNNKAIFSIDIESIDMNYKKYKNLLLSNIFFDDATYKQSADPGFNAQEETAFDNILRMAEGSAYKAGAFIDKIKKLYYIKFQQEH